jgi:hypothetical protein
LANGLARIGGSLAKSQTVKFCREVIAAAKYKYSKLRRAEGKRANLVGGENKNETYIPYDNRHLRNVPVPVQFSNAW